MHMELYTDASVLGLGGILPQKIEQGKLHFKRSLLVLLYTERATMGGTKRNEP